MEVYKYSVMKVDSHTNKLKGLVRQEKVYKKEGMKEEKAPFLIELRFN